MKTSLCFLAFLVGIVSIEAQENLLGSKAHRCIRCLCHAVSGCYMLKNCARYTITYDYWMNANHPTVDIDDGSTEAAYKICMKDDNCILRTINNYTNRMGTSDCNCDGEFNCEDMFAIHYDKCDDPKSISMWETRKRRFRTCSGLNMDDPIANCIPDAV